MEPKVCTVCGTVFHKKINVSRANWALSKYCSPACARKNTCFTKGLIPWSKGKSVPNDVREKIKNSFQIKHCAGFRIRVGKIIKPCIPWNKNKRYRIKEGTQIKQDLKCFIRGCSKYRDWRMSVFERDNYTCTLCGRHRIKGDRVVLEADHIKPFCVIMKENNIRSIEEAMSCEDLWRIENGRTLCRECHKKTDTHGSKASKAARQIQIN